MGIRSLAVVGGGNGAHALAALAAARGIEVKIWAPIPEEAAALQRGVWEHGGIEAVLSSRSIKGLPAVISSDPAQAIPGSDLIILVLPAFAHREVLFQARPYLNPDSIIGAMPSRSGFEFMARNTVPPAVTVFGVQTLPWACRIRDYGKKVEILGTKKQVLAAAAPPARSAKVCGMLREILELEVAVAANMLAITLGNVGQIIHPGIMYGLFGAWDGRPFPEEKIPLFYQGVTEEMGIVLERLSEEILAVKRDLAEKGQLDLGTVMSLREWILTSYENSIEDKSTLQRCFNTNKSYQGLQAPVKLAGGEGYVPDFTSRYLTEDLPYGLVVTRALAQLAGTPTPMMDQVITVMSKWMGKEYLVNGLLRGKDLRDAPIPQNYGIHKMAGLQRIIS